MIIDEIMVVQKQTILLCGAIPPKPVKGGIASHSGVREIQVKLD
jgi:hypothetical protein